MRSLNLPINYNPRKIVLNSKISNKILEKLTRGNGRPDFEDENVEEKGPKMDQLRPTQWARAILNYRLGETYKVAWRFTRLKSKVFKDVFSFYEWQLKQVKINGGR